MGELEAVVRKAIAAFEKLDGDAIIEMSSPDIQGVDEISRKWLRGAGAFKDYFNSLQGQISNVHTTLNDIHETVYGDIGLVTCWLEQDYTMGGQKQHVSSPTSCVLRKEGDSWKAILFHTIPLPEESN
jgi:ketosteroid isomerase-like protein